MSTGCKFERMSSTLRKMSTNLSLIKWQSIFICLVLSWKVGLDAIAIAAWLSQNTIVGRNEVIFKSFKSLEIHVNSLVTKVKALYLASMEDLETVTYFFDFHDMRESLKKIQKFEVDLLVLRQAPKSAST